MIVIQSLICTKLNDQTVRFLISHLFAFSLNVRQYYLTQSDATTPGQSEPWNNDNKGVLPIPQSSSITGASPISGTFVEEDGDLTPLQRCRQYILQPQLTGLFAFWRPTLCNGIIFRNGISNLCLNPELDWERLSLL